MVVLLGYIAVYILIQSLASISWHDRKTKISHDTKNYYDKERKYKDNWIYQYNQGKLSDDQLRWICILPYILLFLSIIIWVITQRL